MTTSIREARSQLPIWVLSAATLLLAGVVYSGSAPSPEPVVEPAPTTAPLPEPAASQAMTVPAAALGSPIPPIPARLELDAHKVALGQQLFHDPALSRDGTISCSSCHDLSGGGDDGRRVSVGIGGAQGTVNAPTVLNSGFNFRQFWDGRARTLEEQVDGPIQHPKEMDMRWPTLLEHLRTDPGYAQQFNDVFGGPATQDRVKDAIATFERSLTTPGSAFDRYLLGDTAAISPQARTGYELFVSLGCITCHQGVNAGGNMFQPIGKMGDYFTARGGEIEPADLGRFNVTGEERDRYTFKVPSLRNIALTAPYFHDGSAPTLADAVQIMARVQLGEDLSVDDVASMVAFLESLTGAQPKGR